MKRGRSGGKMETEMGVGKEIIECMERKKESEKVKNGFEDLRKKE